MNILHTLGLMMRVSEIEDLQDLFSHVVRERREALIASAEWEAKFKLAATDLAKQAEEIAELKVRLHYAEPRAIKWDNCLMRSRARKRLKSTSPNRCSHDLPQT